jgi:hypothetical protein
MIDVPTMMIVGVVVQAAMPARSIIAALRPRLRGPGVLASIAFTPLPHADPTLNALVAAITAPATPIH